VPKLVKKAECPIEKNNYCISITGRKKQQFLILRAQAGKESGLPSRKEQLYRSQVDKISSFWSCVFKLVKMMECPLEKNNYGISITGI
jgi:hypothetical protein